MAKSVSSMHIEKADNGFMCTTQMDNGKDGPWESGTKTVHATPEEMSDHVMKTLGGKKVTKEKKSGLAEKAAKKVMTAK